MRIPYTRVLVAALAATGLAGAGLGQSLRPDLKPKVEAKLKQLQVWSTDPVIVAAVKAYNANIPAENKAMTQEKWQGLSILDPFVRSFSKNPLGQYLKSKQTEEISECFVSGVDGTKVAFLAKTSNWSHADKDKHKVPMTGKTFIGPAAVDESSGQLQVQVGLPVLDGAKPIGSIVVGLSVAKLK